MTETEDEIHLGLYSNEAAAAIELILDVMHPMNLDHGYARTLNENDWSIRSNIGEVILIPVDYSGKDWYLCYLKDVFKSFLRLLDDVVDLKTTTKMLIEELKSKGRIYDISSLDVAKTICEEAFLDVDEQSNRFKKIAGEPFQPFKAAALNVVLDELWNYLYRPNTEEICNKLKNKALDIIYDRQICPYKDDVFKM